MAPEYFLKNIYKNKIMNDTSVGFVPPLPDSLSTITGAIVYGNMADFVTKYG